MMLVSALVVLALVGGFVGLFLYLGHRHGQGDLITPHQEFGKREYGQRPAIPSKIHPAPPAPRKRLDPVTARAPDPVPLDTVPDQMAEERVASISEPESSPEPVHPDGAIAPEWRREGPSGHARISETSYTAQQYAEREVKALLLQNHPNRAFTHARRALKLSPEDALNFVERVARGSRV